MLTSITSKKWGGKDKPITHQIIEQDPARKAAGLRGELLNTSALVASGGR